MLVADGDHDPLKNSLLVEVETHEDRRVDIYPYDEAAVEVRRDHEIEEDSDETDDDVDVEGAYADLSVAGNVVVVQDPTVEGGILACDAEVDVVRYNFHGAFDGADAEDVADACEVEVEEVLAFYHYHHDSYYLPSSTDRLHPQIDFVACYNYRRIDSLIQQDDQAGYTFVIEDEVVVEEQDQACSMLGDHLKN